MVNNSQAIVFLLTLDDCSVHYVNSSNGDEFMKLAREFYSRDTAEVAREILGKILVHRTEEGVLKGKIVEVEAYLGLDDPGSIGFRRVKSIPKALLMPAGHTFVYFTYGNHWMLNVNSKKGKLGAVLIRALDPLDGIEIMKKNRGVDDVENLTNGPGKLTKAFGIDKRHNGLDLTGDELFIEDSDDKVEVAKSTRIGISKGRSKLLRFYVKGNRFVSKSR
jgi:DNA-3-methyladenine glycosylase